MENNENFEGKNLDSNNESNPGLNPSHFDRELKVTPISTEYLREIAKWTKFLSILGMIGMAFYVLVGIFMTILFYLGSSFGPSQNNAGAVAILPLLFMMIIICAIYIAPIWWLYKFSSNLNQAIILKNTEQLTTAFSFLNKHYKFIGIMTLIVIGLYILGFIGIIGSGVLTTLMAR